MTDSRINWYNLTAEERASLTEEQVRDYCRVAAMEAGVVLSTTETEFLPEVYPTLETSQMWVVEAPAMPSGIAFSSEQDARAFMALNIIGVDSKYLGSGWADSVKVIREMTGLKATLETSFIDEEEYNRAKVLLDEYGNNVKFNNELRLELDKRTRSYEDACKYVWEEYHAAKNKLAQLAEVRRCWMEYLDLAKDKASAVTFMLKAYTDAALLGEALGANWNISEATCSNE